LVFTSASTFWLIVTERRNFRAPIPAYAKKITRQAGMNSHPLSVWSRLTAQPQVITPSAAPAVPRRVYHRRISRRSASGVRCASDDSSTALKGPISLPLCLISFGFKNIKSLSLDRTIKKTRRTSD
jgi:hypothetical protein